jgi:uncharacterized protein YggE
MLQQSSCFTITLTEVSKTNYLTALAIVALVVVSVFAITRSAPTGSVWTNPLQKTITVNGVGTVETSPDEALLTLGVNNQAATADQAAKDNANTMSQVLSAILGLSPLNPVITKEDITTTDYSLTPVYTQPDKCFTSDSAQPVTCSMVTPQLVGYAVRNQIQVTVKDMTSIGRVLDVATGAGVNDVGGVTFTFTRSTYTNLQKQALQNAIQDASSQAQTMADGLGVHITGIVSITPAYVYQPYVNAKLNTAAGGTSTPIQTGTLQVTVNVQVVYEISA